MVRQPKLYNALPRVPFETVSFQIETGDPLLLTVFQEVGTEVLLIQCDKCSRFLPLRSQRSPVQLKQHRDTKICRDTVEANAKRAVESGAQATEGSSIFVNVFQEAGPSEFGIAHSTVSTEMDPTPVPTTPSSFSPNLTPRATSPKFPGQLFHDLPGSSPISSPQSSQSEMEIGNSDMGKYAEDNFISENACTGQLVKWVAGSIWENYAYGHHDDDSIPWTPIGFEPESNYIRLQSKKCCIILETNKERNLRSCTACQDLLNKKELDKFMDRANADTLPHTPWKFLTARQLKNMLIISRKLTQEFRLKVLQHKRQIGKLQKRVSDYQRVVMLISQNKIAGVSRILAVALRNGANAEAVCRKLQQAITSTYAPRSGWTSREFDTAFLIKAIGGPRLLYTLQKAEAYPSLSTLKKHKPIPEVFASLGIPNKADFNMNITSLLGKKGRVPPKNLKVGQVIMIDGAAIEEAIRFDFKRKSLLGLCREHSKVVKKSVESVDDIKNVANALYTTKECHFGKDATVVGIAPITDEENYHVTPLIVSSSCKSETGEQIEDWVGNLHEAYRIHPDGEKRHGAICTLGTDGESSFRKLRSLLGLKEPLNKDSDLGKKLSVLPGLNLQTGKYGILGTCDPKHVVKRFATMIRSPKGIQVGDVHITSGDTLRALQELEGMTLEKAALLLNPADKQNVPKAVNLIQSLFDLKGLKITRTPALRERVRGVTFIGKVLSYFTFPFIDVKMSLSEQIRSLSTYSHLITALYKRHALEFMTSALLADSQAIVKNILFTLARLQLVDTRMCYYILFEGTDRLENLFSHVRTQDHARNFDIQQLSHKLSIAAEIDAIFQRNPDLNRGHVRRNLVNARGVDHMNPKSWIGNVCVGDVDLQAEYLAGRDKANEVLMAHFYDRNAAIDFNALFSDPEVDHLRPNKEYIGFRTGDDSEEEHLASSTTGQLFGTTEFGDARDTIDTNEFNGIDVEPENLNTPPKNKLDAYYLSAGGDKLYIPTLINNLLGADREQKAIVTMRPLRVQGLTIQNALRKSEDLNSSGDKLDEADGKVKSGDLGAILTCVGDQICLAVVEALNFRQGNSKTNIAVVDVNDLDAEGPKTTTVALQILQLVEEPSRNDMEERTWWWPQTYIQIQDNHGGPILNRHFVTRIPGRFFHPLSPQVVYNSADNPVWSLKHVDLERALDRAWSDLNPDSDEITDTVKSLPQISGQGLQKLPYQLLEEEGSTLYITNEQISVPLNLVKLAGNVQRDCHFCGQYIRISDMRNHIGAHILKAHRNVSDPTLEDGKQIGLDPCGWCGKDGCKTHLIKTGKTSYKITSNCEYHYANMQYAAASKPSAKTPCTNIPLNCPICPVDSNERQETFWKYEFMTHMISRHLTELDELPILPLELIVTTHISKGEEIKMGIPQVKTDEWRDNNQVLDSDDVALVKEEDEDDDEQVYDDEWDAEQKIYENDRLDL